MTKQTITQKARSSGSRKGFSLIPESTLHKMYSLMVACQMMEATQGKATRAHEAANVALSLNLREKDVLVSGNRDWSLFWLRGHSLKSTLEAMRGSKSRSSATVAVTKRTQYACTAEMATGLALQAQMDATGSLVACLFEAKDLERWLMAMKLAADGVLPLLFLCRNQEKGAAGLASQAIACGVPTISVDGKDAVALYRVIYESAAKARNGTGPTLVEISRWPFMDSASRRQDSLDRLEIYLRAKGMFPATLRTRSIQKFRGRFKTASARKNARPSMRLPNSSRL